MEAPKSLIGRGDYQLTGQFVDNVINYDPYGSIIGYQRKSPGTADASNSAAHNIYSGFAISSITQSSAIPQVTGYEYSGPVGTTGSTTTTTIKPTVTSLDIITGSTIITGADTLQSILISQAGTGVVDSSQVVTGLFSLQDTNSYYFTGTTESFGYLSSEQPVLSLSGSTLTLDGPFLLTDGNPQFSGTLGVSIVGTGVVDVGTGGFGEISDALFTDGTGNNSVAPDLVVQGSVFQDGVVQLGTGTDSSFISISSTGSYTFVDSSIFVPTPEPGKPVNSLVNNGFMEIAGGNNVLETPIINSGTIDVANGATVTFAGGIVDAGGQLNFSDGADVFFDSPQAMGLPHSGNSISIQPGITYNFDNGLTQPTAFLFGGTDAAVTIDAPSGSAQPQPLISISDVAAGPGSALVQASGTTSQVSLVSGNLNVTVSAGTNQITLGTEAEVSVQGGAETVLASGANETIRGNDVGDVIEAANLQAGSDVILTSTNAMVTLGNAGIALVGSTGSADTILSAGGTVIDVGTHDVMSVTGGVVYAYGANASVTAAGDSVIVADSAMITTTGGNNLISMGGPGSSVLVASAGQDTVQVAGGLTVQGGAASLVVRNVGSGAVSISQGSGAVTANGGAGAVTLFGGTAGDNVLIGGTGAANMLDAAVGNATLQAAGSGATTLIGGAGAVDFIAAGGAETMLGGTGTGAANRFIFGTNAASVTASIFGFASSTSQIMLEDGVRVLGQSVAARGDLVTLSNGGSILLMGVNAALSAGAVNNGVTVLR
nr:putative tail lysozyme [uncultured Acidiphilium sp.]